MSTLWNGLVILATRNRKNPVNDVQSILAVVVRQRWLSKDFACDKEQLVSNALLAVLVFPRLVPQDVPIVFDPGDDFVNARAWSPDGPA